MPFEQSLVVVILHNAVPQVVSQFGICFLTRRHSLERGLAFFPAKPECFLAVILSVGSELPGRAAFLIDHRACIAESDAE